MSKIVNWKIAGVIDSHQSRKNKHTNVIDTVLIRKSGIKYKHFLGKIQIKDAREGVARGHIEALENLDLIEHNNEDIVWNGKNKSNEPESNNRDLNIHNCMCGNVLW